MITKVNHRTKSSRRVENRLPVKVAWNAAFMLHAAGMHVAASGMGLPNTNTQIPNTGKQ